MSRCSSCGAERRWLHHHHIVPKSEGGPDAPENIQELCANCHVLIHGGHFGGHLARKNTQSPEARAKRSESMKAAWRDPERRKGWLANLQQQWNSPERLAKAAEAQRTPEYRKNRSELAKALMADPERRVRIAESMRRVRQERFWTSKRRLDKE